MHLLYAEVVDDVPSKVSHLYFRFGLAPIRNVHVSATWRIPVWRRLRDADMDTDLGVLIANDTNHVSWLLSVRANCVYVVNFVSVLTPSLFRDRGGNGRGNHS